MVRIPYLLRGISLFRAYAVREYGGIIMKKQFIQNFLVVCFLLFLVFLNLPVLSATLEPGTGKEDVDQSQSDTDEEEFTRLVQFIDKYTNIATKTKLNVDYVPGMVTVLRGEDLRVRGINNVWEAMSLVPGMDIRVNSMGLRDVLVRGIGNTISSGNLKIQLNGISMNSALWGKAYPALDIPVEQIDRIEIIRGPGSAIHGEFASTGVINIITLNKGRQISAGIGRYDSYHGSALYSFSDSTHEMDFSLNVAGFDTNGANITSGPDQLYGMGMGNISNAPGPVNEARDVKNAIMEFSFKRLNFTGYYLNEGQGDYFGFLGSLPPPHSNKAFRFENYGGEIKQELNMTEDLLFEYNLGFFQHQFSSALTFQQPPGFAGIYTNGMAAEPFYQEDRLDSGFDFTYSGWNSHMAKFGVAYANTEIDSAWHETNYIPSTRAPINQIIRFAGSENWIKDGVDRALINMTLQDEFKVNDAVSITGGLRYDHYNDVGAELSPRIAAVWRITQNHILKTQYARAFCPPTFNQLYSKNNPYLVGNPAIDPETIDTLELSYLYRDELTMGRVTYFYSHLDNLISSGGGTYSNTGSTRISGAELELEYKLIDKFKIDSNISYSHSRNSLTGGSIPEVAEWLGDLGIIFEPNRDMAFNIQYTYVGKRNRAVTDTREKLKGYHTIDATVSLYNCLTPRLTLRVGMKNILNEDVYYAAPLYLYINDYPRPGREWWTKISYEF
jgi:outer membrane receptor for ferrienterochelin and colicins